MKPLDEALRRAFWAAGASAVTLSSHAVEKAVQAALASLAADGWVLVPKGATDEMCRAAEAVQRYEKPAWSVALDVYEAMIAAAPKPGETP